MNRQLYDTAYRRALEGKAVRTLWESVLAPFESVEDRKAREAGERDGRAAREREQGSAQPQQA